MSADRCSEKSCDLLFLFGPPAVGKMTVGLEFSRRTGYKLFHNHMTIDLLTEFFQFGSPSFERLNDPIRIMILDELAKAGECVILTAGWRLDVPGDKEIVDAFCRPFRERQGCVRFVELRSDLATRLQRNQTEPRRSYKKVDWATDAVLLKAHQTHRYHSEGDFPYPGEHFIIDMVQYSASIAAELIIDHFDLARNPHT